MIKKSALLMLTISGIIYFILYKLMSTSIALSFLFSSMLLLANYVILAVMWKYIIQQQKAGLAALVALIKYPLMGIFIFWAGRQPWMNSIGIAIGICAFLIIIVLTLLITKDRKIT